MNALTITQLRQWAKKNNFADEWWYCLNGEVKPTKVKIGDIEREGTIQVMNVAAQECGQGEWCLFRYPGFKTDEEIREAEEKRRKQIEPSEKQKIALEFMGHPTEGVTKQRAFELIEQYFQSDSYDGMIEGRDYAEYKWSQRHRIYSSREILWEQFSRLQCVTHEVRASVADSRRDKLLELALERGVDEHSLANFLRQQDPSLFVATSTRRIKQNEAEIWREVSEGMRREERGRGRPEVRATLPKKRGGCFSLILFAGIFVAALAGLVIFR